MEIELLGKWPDDESQVKDIYTATEIKKLAWEIQKEINAMERQANYHRNMDRDHEVKVRMERADRLKKYFPMIEKAISEWFKD